MAKRIKRDPFYEERPATERKTEDNVDGYDFRLKKRTQTNMDIKIPQTKARNNQNVQKDVNKEDPHNKNIKLNRKQRKQEKMQLLYENLKCTAPYPSMVEFEDIGCADPFIYNIYKNIKESIPVPEFWKYKHMKYNPQEFVNPFFDENVQKTRDEYSEHFDNMEKKEFVKQMKYPSMSKQYEVKSKTIKKIMKRSFYDLLHHRDHINR